MRVRDLIADLKRRDPEAEVHFTYHLPRAPLAIVSLVNAALVLASVLVVSVIWLH